MRGKRCIYLSGCGNFVRRDWGEIATVYFVSHGRLKPAKASKLSAVLETFSYQILHMCVKLGTKESCRRNYLRREWG